MRPVHATLVERVRSVSATCGIFLALCVAPAIAATPTTTTLAVGPSNNVATETTVTLTATVTNPSPVTTGLVLFCNATAPHCSQSVGLYGTASLTTSGTAILRMRFGAGVANIQAQFVATSANAASASLTNSVAVTALPSYASVTSLGKTGVMGNYTLTGTVGGLGLNLVSGTVSFLDTTNGNANIGSAVLGSNSTGWAAPVPYATGNAPTGSTVGDLNRDGIPDLAECDYYDGAVSVFLGNGDGTFGARTSYAVGVNPYQVLAGDFNRDGNLDLAVATTTGVSVLFGNGDGTFQSSVSYVITGGSTGIVVADFNGDGFLDLALVNNSQSTLNIMLGNGDGTFQSSVSYPTGKNGTAIAGGDFVGNGIQDLAVTNGVDGTVSVFIGNGDGTFKPQVTYAAGRWPDGITAGDVNNDGKLDLVSANYSDNTVSVYIGNGDGTFQPQVTYPAAGALAVLVADLNGDGNPDLAVINYASTGTVTIYPGNGTGVFNTSTAFPSGKYPGWVSAGDFNGDGRTDLAIPNDSTSVNTISILLGTSTAPFSAGSIAVTGTQGVHNVLASFPGDASHTGSQSPTVALTAPLGPVSVVVTSNNNPSADGSAVILTATLTGSGVNPTGTVQFRDGGSLLTTKAISGSIATYSTGFLAPGTHSITAVYGGNSNYVATTSAVFSQVVNDITPTVSVSCSPNPITYGSQTTTCTTTVSGGATGSVVWTINGTAWTTNTLSGGTASAGGFAGYSAGSYTIGVAYEGDSNNNPVSALTTLIITTAPSVLMWSAGNQFESAASLSLAPVTAGNANGVTAQVFGANSPTGTLAFANGATNYGTLPLQSVSTTNLVLQSNGMSSGWAVNAQALTLNAGQAPDGTNTAASLVSNGGDNQFYQVANTGNISGQTYTGSIWVKGVGAAIGKGGRIWLISGDWSSINGCDVPITSTWARVSCTASFGPGFTTTQLFARYDLPRYGEAAGDTVFVWGPQLEASSSVGPYVPTTTAAVTMSQPVATAGSYVTSPGVYTVTAAYGGDGSNAAASGSTDLTAVAATPISVISVSPATTPYGSAVNMSALISTGGDAPTGTVNFASDGGNVASAAPTSATTENYIPFSRDFTKWSWEATNPTSVTRATVPGPNGLPGDVATVVFPSTTGTYSGIRYTDSTTNLVGKTMTFSFWVRGDAPSNLSVDLADWPWSGNFAAGNGCSVTTTWQQCTVSGTFPSNANGGFYVPIRSDNQTSPMTVYLWGAQLNEGTAGPYVSTAGTSRSASGGVATGSVSTLAVGTHAMTAAVSADANVNAATSAAVTETITDATEAITVSCSPNPSAYGAVTSCTAHVPSGTGTVVFDGGSTRPGPWTEPVNGSGNATLVGFTDWTAGAYTVTAAYSGDSDYSAASATTTLVINPSTPTVTLSCSPTSIVPRSTTTCTATVPAPDGSVAFYSSASFTGKWWNAPFPAGGGDLAGTPVATTQDAQIDYNIIDYPWPGAIAAPSGVNSTGIYARWTGTFVSPASGAYTIGVNSDDGASVYVNGTPIVSNLSGMQGATSNLAYTQSGQITLVAGATNTIVVEYQQNLGGAAIQLLWTPPGAINPSLLGWTVVPVNSSGQASITGGASWPHGSYSITGAYSGDSNFTVATSNPVSLAVSLAPTVTELSASANPITYGGSTIFTALVDTGGSPVLGTTQVAFTSNGVSIGSGTVSTVTTTNLLPYSVDSTKWGVAGGGSNSANSYLAPDGSMAAFVYNYPGGIDTYEVDAAPITTVSVPYTFSVWARVPSGTLATNVFLINQGYVPYTNCSVNLTMTWQRFTCTGAPSSGDTVVIGGVGGFGSLAGAAGSIELWGGQVEQAATAGPYVATTGASATGNGGIATLTTTTLAAGSDSIVAVYSGDANTLASTSATLAEIVTDAASTVSLSSSVNPASYGTSVTFTAQATATASTGSMTFYDGATLLGVGTMSGGSATYTASGLGSGTHSITASYGGDSDYSPAVSAALSEVITRTAATVSMTSTFSPSTYGQSVTFTFTAAGILGTPSGTVAISDGATLLATPTLNASGVATYTTANLIVGSHSLTAVYGGDANYK